MSVLLRRRGTTEYLGHERFTGYDAGGAQDYQVFPGFAARYAEESEEIVGPDGSKEMTTLSVWVDGETDVLEMDRVVLGDRYYIVRRREVRRSLRTMAIVMTKLLCREEGA